MSYFRAVLIMACIFQSKLLLLGSCQYRLLVFFDPITLYFVLYLLLILCYSQVLLDYLDFFFCIWTSIFLFLISSVGLCQRLFDGASYDKYFFFMSWLLLSSLCCCAFSMYTSKKYLTPAIVVVHLCLQTKLKKEEKKFCTNSVIQRNYEYTVVK